MKKSITYFFLLCFFSCFAQTEALLPVEKNHLKLFIGVGSSYNKDYRINSYLEKNGIIKLSQFDINFLTGLNYYDDYVDIDLGYEMFAIGTSNDETSNRILSNGIKLRAQYILFSRENFAFGAGFNIGYAKKNLSLYWKNYEVDFDNLPQGINGNELSMYLEKAFLGPSICFKGKGWGRNFQQTKITLAYEFALNNKAWESDTFKLKNQIKEPNTQQLVLNVTFGL